MSKMLELSVNLGDDEAVKVVVSNVDLQGALSELYSTKSHFIVGEPTEQQVMYNAIVKDDVLEKLGNPTEVWVYVE